MKTTMAIFEWIAETSWQAAVLAALIFAAHWLARKRISPAWRYGLWMLLIARLLMPGLPESPWSIFNLAARPSAIAKAKPIPFAPVAALPAPAMPAANGAARAPVDRVIHRTVNYVEMPESQSRVPALPQPAKAPLTIPWRELACVLWLAGTAYLLLRLIWTNARFSKKLRACPPTVSGPVFEEFMACHAIIGVRETVQLLQTDAVSTPAVYGFFTKRLLLPPGLTNNFSRSDLRHVFLHELAHIRRCDLEVNWVAAVLKAVHWFNPVLWLAFARMRADRELATDALVLSRVRPSEGIGYGETILRLVEWLPRPAQAASLVGIAEEKHRLEERVRHIAGIGERKYWSAIALAIFALLAIFVCTDARVRAALAIPADNDPLGESGASRRAKKAISELKRTSRWTLGPKAALFGDDDGEVSAGFVRSVQICDHAMTSDELFELGEASAHGITPPNGSTFLEWNFQNSLVSTDGKQTLTARSATPGAPAFEFTEQEIAGEKAQVLSFGAGTYFVFSNPFRDAAGQPLISDYTVIMDVMFPAYPSRWAALWQTDPENKSDAEWFISSEKGLGITDEYGDRVTPGEWHRLALLVEGSAARFRSFIDGVEVQRKELDVKDEFYNRRSADDVLAWTALLEKLKKLADPEAETAVKKFTTRLENGQHRQQEASAVPLRARPAAARNRNDPSGRAWAASLSTPDLIQALTANSRWTLGPEALLFADENGENGSGWISALQLRDYAMTDREVSRLGGAAAEIERDNDSSHFAQWDFSGNLDSATGGEELIPISCSPAPEPEFGFTRREPSDREPGALHFGRGTAFRVPVQFGGKDNDGGLLNYSIVMDLKIEERPVGWFSLWQNDPLNHTDSDWFINKKQQLGIRDLYGGFIEDGKWHRLALVVDGRKGVIAHYINGKKVREKRMIMEDDYSRRGGAERTLDRMIALLAELQTRPEPEAADMYRVFSRRMHNRPDPEARFTTAAVRARVTSHQSGQPLSGVRVYYQAGESNEDFFPEFKITDKNGFAKIELPLPVGNIIHLTARADGFAPESTSIAGSSLADSGGTSIELRLHPALTVGGKIVGPRGEPLPLAEVCATLPHTAETQRAVPSWADGVLTTDNGIWKTVTVPADADEIRVRVRSFHAESIFDVGRGTDLFSQLGSSSAVLQMPADAVEE